MPLPYSKRFIRKSGVLVAVIQFGNIYTIVR